jgi:hypothetical protein
MEFLLFGVGAPWQRRCCDGATRASNVEASGGRQGERRGLKRRPRFKHGAQLALWMAAEPGDVCFLLAMAGAPAIRRDPGDSFRLIDPSVIARAPGSRWLVARAPGSG